jgi:hypothetical protein
MTTVDELLNEIAPAHGWSESWPDVLRRADEQVRVRPQNRPSTLPRRRLLLAALVAVIVIAAPLVAVAASNDWWFLNHPDPLSVPATSPLIVKEGQWDGKGWDLIAYPNRQNGLCWGITPTATRDTGTGGALGCGSIVGFPSNGRNPAMSITFVSGGASPELPAYVAGPVVATAAKVVIHFATATVTAETFAAPKELGDLRFYAAQVPDNINPARPPTPGQPLASPISWLAGYDKGGMIVACLNPTTAKDGISPPTVCQ